MTARRNQTVGRQWRGLRKLAVGFVVGLALVLPACVRSSPVARALSMARRHAQAMKDPGQKLALLTAIGVEWMAIDPRRSTAILHEAKESATRRKDIGDRARVAAIARCAVTLSRIEPQQATSILLDALRQIEHIDNTSIDRFNLLAALASYDVDEALKAANHLPSDQRKTAFGEMGRRIAATDFTRGKTLMAAALGGRSPLVDEADSLWAELAIAAARDHPTEVLRLSKQKIAHNATRTRVLWAVLEALAPTEWTRAETAIREEPEPTVRCWGYIVLAHESRGRQRLVAIERARQVIGSERVSEANRFSLVTRQCLLAVMAADPDVAQRHLLAAEKASGNPPGSPELGLLLAAASYTDPGKVMDICGELIRRTDDADSASAARWVVALTAKHAARVDNVAAKLLLVDRAKSGEPLESAPAAELLAGLARSTLRVGPRASAEWLVQQAHEALRAQQRTDENQSKHAQDPRALWQSMAAVAVATAEFGDGEEAMRIAASISDPAVAASTCLEIARALGRPAVDTWDPFDAVHRVAVQLQGVLLRPADPVPLAP